MNLPATTSSQLAAIPAMSESAIGKVVALENAVLEMPQVSIPTDHVLHGGMYARTIMVPAGVVLTGALIKLATMLIINGDVTVFVGDSTYNLVGYHIIPASAGRKQAFVARADTYLTMIFPTSATTVEQAEEEFTDEADRLFSRTGENFVRITGE